MSFFLVGFDLTIMSTLRLLFLQVLVVALCLGPISATVYVADYGNDGWEGSEVAPFKTIAHAIEEDNDIVLLGTNLSAAGNSNLNVRKSLTISGSNDDQPIVINFERNGGFLANNNGTYLSLSNIKFVDASESVVSVNTNAGFDLNLLNCEFVDTTVVRGKGVAGAVSVISLEETEVYLHGCTFQDNSVAAGNGAGLFVNSLGEAKVSIIASTFNGNTASGSGGAVYLNIPRKSTVTVTCDQQTQGFYNNQAGSGSSGSAAMGGAFYIEGNDANDVSTLFEVSAEMQMCTLQSNQATFSGGAMALVDASVKIQGSTLVNNAVTGQLRDGMGGGGVFVTGGTFGTDEQSFFVRNSAPVGGGLFMVKGLGGLVRLASFDDNIADKEGMQVWVESDDVLTFDGVDFNCQEDYCNPTVGAIVISNGTTVNLNNIYRKSTTNVTHLDSLTLYPLAKVFVESYTNTEASTAEMEIYRLTLSARSSFEVNAPLTIAEHGSFMLEGGTVITTAASNLTILSNATLSVVDSNYISELPSHDLLVKKGGNVVLESQLRLGFYENDRNMYFEEGSSLLVKSGMLLHAHQLNMGGKVEVASYDDVENRPKLYTNFSLLENGSLQVDVAQGQENGMYVETVCFNGGGAGVYAGDGSLERGDKYYMLGWDVSQCGDSLGGSKLGGSSGIKEDDVKFVIDSTELYMLVLEGDKGGLGAGAVFGIVMAVIVVLAILVGVLVWRWKVKKDSFEVLAGGTERVC